jgi:DNA-binding NtrC family response regulator
MHSNARLFAATDQDLYAEGFNQALLRRLESFTIHIPPLRARREDIGVLMAHAARAWPLQNLAPREIPSTLVNQLLNYDWPGNVRQLSHVLKRIQLILQFGETPSFETLVGPARPAASQASAALAADASNAKPRSDIPARQRLAEISADDVLNAMEANQWYIQGAAQALGVSRPYMYKLLQEHPRIRKAERIPAEEIRAALAACADDFERCASMLKTPTEALRRAWRTMDATRL